MTERRVDRERTTPRVARLSRRGFLVASAGTVLAAACSSGSSGPDRFLARFFGDRTSQPGTPQRFPFGVADEEGVILSDPPATVTATVLLDETAVIDSITLDRHGEGIPRPYYPLVFTPPDEGVYTARFDIDGTTAETQFQVSPTADVPLLQVGATLPGVDTPTVADGRGVEPICTRDPQCPFHEQTLDEALATGDPVALLVSTPAFCTTGICGPVLDMLIEAAPARAGLRVVHAEVYADAVETGDIASATVTPAVEAMGLTFEPSLFVTDDTGVVTSRLDFIWDLTELDAALATSGT